MFGIPDMWLALGIVLIAMLLGAIFGVILGKLMILYIYGDRKD